MIRLHIIFLLWLQFCLVTAQEPNYRNQQPRFMTVRGQQYRTDHRPCCDRYQTNQRKAELCNHFCAPSSVPLIWSNAYRTCIEDMWPMRQCFYEYEMENPAWIAMRSSSNNRGNV